MLVLALARGLVWLPKKRRWMHGRENAPRKFRRQYLAAFARDSKRRSENRLCCRRAHGNHQLWLNNSQLRFQPRSAGGDLARIWFLMNPSFAAGLPLKMFHRVRHINLGSINSSFLKRLVHDFPGGSNERSPGDVFIISRLFANQHDRGVLWAFAKHSLRCTLVKMTRRAVPRHILYFDQTRSIRRRRRSSVFFVSWHTDYKSQLVACSCSLTE